MRLGLLLGELAARDELADERVVAGEADQVAVAQQVAARVADVRDHDGVVVRGRRRSSSCPCPRAARRARASSWIRAFAAWISSTSAAAGSRPSGSPPSNCSHRDLGRDLAGLRAAHPVRDHEQRRADEEVVLVALALAAQVGVVEVLGDAQHRVSARR